MVIIIIFIVPSHIYIVHICATSNHLYLALPPSISKFFLSKVPCLGVAVLVVWDLYPGTAHGKCITSIWDNGCWTATLDKYVGEEREQTEVPLIAEVTNIGVECGQRSPLALCRAPLEDLDFSYDLWPLGMVSSNEIG